MINVKKKKDGFTLVELVVVMSIIAVLATAFTPKLSGYMEEARKVGVLDQAKRILTAYENINLKSNTLSETSSIALVIKSSGGIIAEGEITKIPLTFTISQCRELLNTEKFNFTMTNGIANAPTPIAQTQIN